MKHIDIIAAPLHETDYRKNLGCGFFPLLWFLLFGLEAIIAPQTHAEEHPALWEISVASSSRTAEETMWLSRHPVLRVAGPKAFPPFHFFDENGKAAGMAYDYLMRIAGKLSLTVEIQDNLSWPQVLEKAREKEIDLISCLAVTPERQHFLLFSRPYLTFPLVIVSRKDSPFIGGINDLSGIKTAFVRDNVVYDWIRKDRIEVIPHFVATPLEALRQISVGHVEAHIENLAAASYLIEKHGLANLKIAAPTPYQDYTLHMAVRGDLPALASLIDKALQQLSPEEHAEIRNKWLTVRYEHGIRREDIWKWILLIAGPAFAALFAFFFWNKRLQDEIRDRKAAETALRESEQRYRMITENTSSLIAVLDPHGTYEFANPAHHILGYEPQELIGTSGISRIHPDDSTKLTSLLQQGILGETSQVIVEYRAVGKDNQILFIQGTFDSIRNSNGGLEKIVFVGDDITLHKLDQEALAREKDMLSLVLEGTRAGIWEWDIVSDTILLNDVGADLIGYPPAEFRSMSARIWNNLCHPEDRILSDKLLAKCLSGRTSHYEQECRVRHRNGHWLWIHIRGKVVKSSEDGKPIWMVGTFLDVSRRKRAEEEKAAVEIRNRQIQKTESLSRMAGAVAHHFNNQLHAVIGNIDLAMEQIPGDDPSAKFLVRAGQAARKASDISGLMLTSLGQTRALREPMDLSEICLRKLKQLESDIPSNLVLETILPDPGPVIVANPTQIQQALSQVIHNACEAMSDNPGKIYVSVSTVSSETISSANRFPLNWKPSQDRYACVEITDSGCGISTQNIDSIFDPFFTTQFTGRGLGLPVVLGIVQASAGVVTVNSEIGKGSTFRIFFPESDVILSQIPERPGAQNLSSKTGTVLLIDDEEPVRKMTSAMLSRLGWEVVQAADGFEALQLLQTKADSIQCVLTDLTMPNMTGWEVISRIRAIRPNIPVILLSGYDEIQVMKEDHPVKPQAFLKKPYRIPDLRDTLLQVLAASSD